MTFRRCSGWGTNGTKDQRNSKKRKSPFGGNNFLISQININSYKSGNSQKLYSKKRHESQITGAIVIQICKKLKVFLSVCELDKFKFNLKWLKKQTNAKAIECETRHQHIWWRDQWRSPGNGDKNQSVPHEYNVYGLKVEWTAAFGPFLTPRKELKSMSIL